MGKTTNKAVTKGMREGTAQRRKANKEGGACKSRAGMKIRRWGKCEKKGERRG